MTQAAAEVAEALMIAAMATSDGQLDVDGNEPVKRQARRERSQARARLRSLSANRDAIDVAPIYMLLRPPPPPRG